MNDNSFPKKDTLELEYLYLELEIPQKEIKKIDKEEDKEENIIIIELF